MNMTLASIHHLLMLLYALLHYFSVAAPPTTDTTLAMAFAFSHDDWRVSRVDLELVLCSIVATGRTPTEIQV